MGKHPDSGKDLEQEEKEGAEDEKVWWHYSLDGHEFEQTLGDGEEQGNRSAAVHGVANSQTRLSK